MNFEEKWADWLKKKNIKDQAMLVTFDRMQELGLGPPSFIRKPKVEREKHFVVWNGMYLNKKVFVESPRKAYRYASKVTASARVESIMDTRTYFVMTYGGITEEERKQLDPQYSPSYTTPITADYYSTEWYRQMYEVRLADEAWYVKQAEILDRYMPEGSIKAIPVKEVLGE